MMVPPKVSRSTMAAQSLGAERDQEMGPAGAGVPDQAQRLALVDPLAPGQGVDDRGIDAGVGLEVEAA